ncbi:hypothetical protein KC19_9G022900 [Ceratodon purpureus]|uniref:Protein kinase domain-containing protein n=1 Tax=Ceratodon purpureus TaxID=3225 RepID=A0A8T0GR28_CERPU|nr:hypothetical protein KC19_9G022900 [Ceratodon purpureus]
MDISYYERIVRAIGRLESNVPSLKFYLEQCNAMVLDFVHVRNSLIIGANGESALIFKELFRLTCEAERVLANCCRVEWLIAAILQSDRYIFDIIRGDLERCLDILFETRNSSTRVMARHRLFVFELDQEYLRIQLNELLENRTGEVRLRDVLIARFLLARLSNSEEERVLDGLADGVWVNRQKGRVLGGRDPSVGSTVTEITWFGIRFAEKTFLVQLRSECWKEALVMAKLNHPNVVRFISCSMEEGQRPGIIMESEETTLERYLWNRRRQDVGERCRVSQRPVGNRAGLLLDLLVAVDIMEQIALGMAYLHSQNVAHLDLKPANVLLTFCTEHEFPRAKIADFGTSMREVEGKIWNGNPDLGTTVYRAPEVFRIGLTCPKAADVYCFGMTCWQILHCQDPLLKTMTPITCLDHVLQCKGPMIAHVQMRQLGRELAKGRRLDINPAIPPHLRQLIRVCWQTDPDRRPPFSTICLFLQSYRASLLGGSLPVVVFPPVQQQRSIFRQMRRATKNFMLQILPSPIFSSSINDEDTFPEDTSSY